MTITLFSKQARVLNLLADQISISANEFATDNQHWAVDYVENKLSICGCIENQLFTFNIDFADPVFGYRLKKGGGKSEPLIKAIGLKNPPLFVIDATAGLGRESYLMAHLGATVRAFERHPLTALLVQDALQRDPSPPDLTFHHGDSIDILSHWNEPVKPDVIYLDPMFPTRDKSAAVKKEMRIFKALAGEDLDSDQLLEAAIKLATKRVVVKRPKSAPFVAGRKPSFQIVTKKYRFDVYN